MCEKYILASNTTIIEHFKYIKWNNFKTVIIFSGIIPDAFLTECAKCSDRQKKQAGKVLAHLLHYKPDYWKMLVEKFDPNNVYLKKYMTDNDDEDKIPLPTSPQKTSNNSTTNTTSST